jgi:hypothetical protein
MPHSRLCIVACFGTFGNHLVSILKLLEFRKLNYLPYMSVSNDDWLKNHLPCFCKPCKNEPHLTEPEWSEETLVLTIASDFKTVAIATTYETCGIAIVQSPAIIKNHTFRIADQS